MTEPLAEQVVIPIPLTLVVEWHQEEVAMLQAFEDLSRSGNLGNGIAERTIETIKYRCVSQKPRCFGRKAIEDFSRQVGGDIPIVASESPHEPIAILFVPQSESRQLHPRRPTLGPPAEKLRARGVQI
jgi:hypothetical protein